MTEEYTYQAPEPEIESKKKSLHFIVLASLVILLLSSVLVWLFMMSRTPVVIDEPEPESELVTEDRTDLTVEERAQILEQLIPPEPPAEEAAAAPVDSAERSQYLDGIATVSAPEGETEPSYDARMQLLQGL